MKKLNLGCGQKWREQYPDYEGLDIIDFGQKYVGDVLLLLEKNGVLSLESFDEVMANHFLEHFDQDQLRVVFSGVHRILKPGGTFRFIIPHRNKPESWFLSHKTFWDEATVWALQREDFAVYGFGKWEVLVCATNGRGDICAEIRPVK